MVPRSGCLQGAILRFLRGLSLKYVQAYVGGVYRDQGAEVVSEWLTSLLQPHVEVAYQSVRKDHLLPDIEVPQQRETPTARDSSRLSSTSSEGASPASLIYGAASSRDHRQLPTAQANMRRQSSAQAGDGVGTRRAVTDKPRARLRRRRSSPRDGGSEDAGKQVLFLEEIIELIIPNKHIAPYLAIRRWHSVATPLADRSRLDQQCEEAVEGTGYERWMNAIDVAVLSARSI